MGYSGTTFLVLTEDGKIGVFSKVECYELRKPKKDLVFEDLHATGYEEYLTSVHDTVTEHGDMSTLVLQTHSRTLSRRPFLSIWRPQWTVGEKRRSIRLWGLPQGWSPPLAGLR